MSIIFVTFLRKLLVQSLVALLLIGIIDIIGSVISRNLIVIQGRFSSGGTFSNLLGFVRG